MSWEFCTEPEFEAQLEWMKAFVREEVEPIQLLWPELHHRKPAPWLRKVIDPLKERVKKRGLWAAHLGPEYGGTGFGQVKLALMNEILGPFWWAQTIFGVQGPDTSNAVILARYGTEAQKNRYFKPLLEGETFSCFAMTEPQGGGDPGQFTTTATREGDGWLLNGDKFFASNADAAEFLLVVAITDQKVSVHKGASIFLVPRDASGLSIIRPTSTMGHPLEGSEFGHPHVRFDNVKLPADSLLGEPGSGFEVAQTRLANGRLYHSMRTVGVCQRALDMMCERALSRTTKSSLLAEKQLVQQTIANSYAELQQFRLYVLYTAWQIDQLADPGRKVRPSKEKLRQDVAMCKVTAYRLHRDIVERSVHLHGALGCSNEMPLGQMWMDAPTQSVMDGPYEVHQINAAKNILKGYKPAPGLWPTEWLPAKMQAARAKYEAVLAEQSAYERQA